MKWTDEEIKILKDSYKNYENIEEIAKKLKRSCSSIKAKAHDLKITHTEKYFTTSDINFIRENCDKLTYKQIGEKLQKKESNICRKCKELKIKKTNLNTNVWKYMTKEKLNSMKLKQRETRIKNGTLNPLINRERPYSRTKGGKREDLNNIYFRSSWEANIARYFNYINVEWQYEPKTFIFKNITRGSVSYTPDFYLPKEDKWVEVKGWMDGKSKTKLKRFKQQYLDEYSKLELIKEKEYKEIKRKISPFIKNWE